MKDPDQTLTRAVRSMDGWMTCDFMSVSTVSQSYQDDGGMTMKGFVQRNTVY